MSAAPNFYPDPKVSGIQLDLSIVVPVFNEREVAPKFYARLKSAIEALPLTYEIVFVDDGSSDGSADLLMCMAAADERLKIILLSRNFGKEAALSAGLAHTTGGAVIVIDADLQDPPELVGDMYRAFVEGADVVCMKRRSREGEPLLKRWSAYLFYRLLNRLSDVEIPEDTGDFRLMSRRAVDALNRLTERNRYMKGLFAWVGLPTTVIEYDRCIRAAGVTKWNFLSLLGLAFEGITSFSTSLLRLATTTGLIAALVGAGFGFWIVIKALMLGDPVHGYPSLIAIITFLGGVQLFAIGLLGEYVGKTYLEAKQRPLYVVKDVVQTSSKSFRLNLSQELNGRAASN